MTRRRLPVASSATIAAALLFDGEVVTNIEEKRLVLGDGVTPGGVPQAKKAEVDAKADRNLGNLTSAQVGRDALGLGAAATRGIGLTANTVPPGDAVATLQATVATLSVTVGTTKVVATVAQLAGIASPAENDRAEVRADPLGDVVNGNGVWRRTGGAWVWLSPLLPDALRTELDAIVRAPDAPIKPRFSEAWLEDAAGNRTPIGSMGLIYDPISDAIVSPGIAIQSNKTDQKHGLWIEDDAGNRHFLDAPAATTTTTTTASTLWTADQYAWADARGAAESRRINLFSTTAFARIADGANLCLTTGQSFAAGAAFARLNLTAAVIAAKGLVFTSYSVGPDSRCVSSGPTYVCFGGDNRTLTPLAEHFIGGTGVDLIYSPSAVATGAYPVNARGGTTETQREFMMAWLRRDWRGEVQSVADPAYFTVAMNHAKTDGSIAEVGLGDGLSRAQSAIAIFTSATGATAKTCPFIFMNHNEADESAGTTDYTTRVQDYDDALWAAIQSNWAQAKRPWFLMHQAGGPNYASNEMIVANQMVEMMIDGTGRNANKTIVCAKYEVPSFWNAPAPNPGTGNAHPMLMGIAIMAVREAVGAHYCGERGDFWWMPFPYEVYYADKNFLLIIPNKFPPLNTATMVKGVETTLLRGLGLSFEGAGGVDNPVTLARVVHGSSYLVEGTCSDTISGTRTFKSGKRLLPNYAGLTNIRDSFTVAPQPPLAFSRNQTIGPTTYVDDPVVNGLARYAEDIAGWRGPDINWGNPLLRRTLTAQPMPE